MVMLLLAVLNKVKLENVQLQFKRGSLNILEVTAEGKFMTEIFPLPDVNQTLFKVDHRWHNLAAQTDPSALQLHSQ